jgi:hypothetical protein
MKKNRCILYRHLKPNGEVFYIGIGNSLKRAYHKYNRNNLWHKIVDKYGFEVQILKDDLTRDEACELEKILIEYYGRISLGTGTLANITSGGDTDATGYKATEETKQKIREAVAKQKIAGWNRGIVNKREYSGENIGTSKLTEKEVIEIRDRYIPYKYTRKMLAEEYNVTEYAIKDIVIMKSWKYLIKAKGGNFETD